MGAELIEGGPVAESIKEEVRSSVEKMYQPPRLVAILATENPGAKYYARSQKAACAEVGIEYELHGVDDVGQDVDADVLKNYIRGVNNDPEVDGVILLMPLPEGINAREMQMAIDPSKDVEGVHPSNIGRLFYGDFTLAPCTAHAILIMLEKYGVDLAGKETVVVGHSEIMGKPTVVMLLRTITKSPTVTCCHIATRDLAAHTRRAEVLIVAAGKAGLIRGDMIKAGAVVIDVGINRVKVEEGDVSKTKIVGDVDFEAARKVAGAITPVPGGVGLVTTAMLLNNTVECARFCS